MAVLVVYTVRALRALVEYVQDLSLIYIGDYSTVTLSVTHGVVHGWVDRILMPDEMYLARSPRDPAFRGASAASAAACPDLAGWKRNTTRPFPNRRGLRTPPCKNV